MKFQHSLYLLLIVSVLLITSGCGDDDQDGSAEFNIQYKAQPLSNFDTVEFDELATTDKTIQFRPILQIDMADQGQPAELYMVAHDPASGAWQARTAGGWESYAGAVPTFETVEALAAELDFNLSSVPFTAAQVEIYYGYRLTQNAAAGYRGKGLRVTVSTTAQAMQAKLATRHAEEDWIPGFLMGVWIPDEGAWFGATGLADIETQQPMREMIDAPYRIGSQTKTFTAMLILQLIDEGYFSLDDTLMDLLGPERARLVDNAERITVRHLLSHRTGICNYILTDTFRNSQQNNDTTYWPPETLVLLAESAACEAAEGVPSLFGEPSYSNTNYILLALIAEAATGNDWEDAIETRFFEPLGMTNSYVPRDGDGELPEGAIVPYWNPTQWGGDNTLVRVGYLKPSRPWAAGNIISTVRDMMTWFAAVTSGELLDNEELINAQRDWFEFTATSEVGLGMFHEIVPNTIEHKGGIPGFTMTSSYQIDTGALMIGVTNTDTGRLRVPREIFYETFAGTSQASP